MDVLECILKEISTMFLRREDDGFYFGCHSSTIALPKFSGL